MANIAHCSWFWTPKRKKLVSEISVLPEEEKVYFRTSDKGGEGMMEKRFALLKVFFGESETEEALERAKHFSTIPFPFLSDVLK